MKCCNEDRSTRHCPECGKRLISSELELLVDHLNKISSQHKRNFDKWTNLLEGQDPNERETKKLAMLLKTANKYHLWATEILKLLEKANA